MTIDEFRALTQRVMDAEKPGFWSDWTPEQQILFTSGNWKAFSRSRGYSEEEIAECEMWLDEIDSKNDEGINILASVADIVTLKAAENIAKDHNNEIMLSSRYPTNRPVSPEDVRGAMLDFEEGILASEHGIDQSAFPTYHRFANGQYIRESHVDAGIIISTRIHKHDHPMFLMKGKATIIHDKGVDVVEAPFHTITKAGTKRIVYMNTDTVCITVHRTDKTTVPEAEKDIWAESFDEIGVSYKRRVS